MQHLWSSMMEGVELLSFGTIFHVFSTVSLDGRPIIVCSQDLRGHCLCPQMVSADSLVYLGQNILDLLDGDALQQGGRVASSV